MYNMSESIARWLEHATGETKRQMALTLNQSPSTFNRNIATAETVVAVCLAYGLNPVEGLVEAGYVTADDVIDYAEELSESEHLRQSTPDDIIERIQVQLGKLSEKLHQHDPVEGQMSLFIEPALLPQSDPDYSTMSERDAYDLAASKGEDNIGHDELPHEP
ncbi:hypothetical protein AR689_10610 [Arthrobacter sp. EpRS71]|nr:hypothetical protein AR689_10610 [Arthrobacter sp. EpRS71]